MKTARLLPIFFASSLALSALTAAAAVRPAPAAAVDQVSDLVQEITKARDEADPQKIEALAGVGTRAAAEGMLEVYGAMGSVFMKREVVKALAEFDGKADAEQLALQKIMDVATQAEDVELREAAVEALGRCSHLGKNFLAMIVESTAADDVREHAMELHVKLGGEADHAWYRELYERRAGEEQEDDGGRGKKKRGKDDEDEEDKELRQHSLARIRTLAFQAIAPTLKDDEVEAAAEDRWHGIRRAALKEMQRRGDRRMAQRARDVFERVDERPENRVLAAEILAEVDGRKAADDFIDYGRKNPAQTPGELRNALADILARMDDESVDKKLERLVGKGKDYEKLFVLRAVRDLEDPKLSKSIQRLLGDKEDAVRMAAARVLGDRGDDSAVPALRKLVDKAKEAEVVATVVAALGKILGDDEEWEQELLGYAKSDETVVRNAALRQLGRMEGAHLDVLTGALEHEDWSTRLEALNALDRLRTKEAIGPIIARMEKESGRMLHEFADVLFDLTGQPYRTAVGNWKAWWQKEGGAFQVISKDELAKRAAEEEERRLRQVTNVKFFGIRIVSHRVSFIIDVSGSMNETLRPQYVGEPGKPRITVAQEQLKQCIDGLDPSALFNVIIFSSGVEPWLEEGVTGSDGKSRQEAKDWVDKLGAGGATNLFDAIEYAFRDPDVDTIFIMSDGEPTAGAETDPSAIRERVAEWNENRGIVINTVAVGGQFQILEWLAEDSGGKHVEFH